MVKKQIFRVLLTMVMYTVAESNGLADSNLVSKVDTNKSSSYEIKVDYRLELAWQRWHKRLTCAIWNRFVDESKMFADKTLKADALYDVAVDGTISNVKITVSSKVPKFDALCIRVVSSMSGDSAVPAFPSGAKESVVNNFIELRTPNYKVLLE